MKKLYLILLLLLHFTACFNGPIGSVKSQTVTCFSPSLAISSVTPSDCKMRRKGKNPHSKNYEKIWDQGIHELVCRDSIRSIIEKRYSDKGDSVRYICVYKFGKNNQLDSITNYDPDANSIYSEYFVYGSTGNLKYYKTYDNGEYNYEISYHYNAHGQVTKSIQKTSEGEVVDITIFRYGKSNYLIKMKSSNSHEKYTYDNCGNLIRVVGNSPICDDICIKIFSYDEHGRVIETHTKPKDQKPTCRGLEPDYEKYDKFGNIIEEKIEGRVFKNTYEFDGHGNWIKECHFSGDRKDPIFIRTRQIFYTE
jgi:hypothetical protein